MKTNEIDAAAEIGADMLRSVRGFLERGWTRRSDAKDANGIPVVPRNPNAVCWCLSGATRVATSHLGDLDEFCALDDVAHALSFSSVGEMIDWNDEPGRTQAEVLARIDQALERSGGGE